MLSHVSISTQWVVFDKDTIDEAIFRRVESRNRIMLELMARGGMRMSEVLNLEPADNAGQKLPYTTQRVDAS